MRWVILLLAGAVILPTVCLLWFMMQAVKNERFAVRQKLVESYTKRAQDFFIDTVDLYFKEKIKYPTSYHINEPQALFEILTNPSDGQFPELLIFDANNNLEYPVLNTYTNQEDNHLTEPFKQELSGNLEDAIKSYEQIAANAESESIRYKASLSKARCLAKLNKKKEAIEIARKISFSSIPRKRDSSAANVIMQARIYLIQLGLDVNDVNTSALLYPILKIPEDYHVIPFVPDLKPPQGTPAETIVWQFEKAIDIAEKAGLANKLEKEIKYAKNRIEAYNNSILSFSFFSDSNAVKTWPINTVRKLSKEYDLYGLKYQLDKKTIIGISSADKMLSILNTAINNIQDNTVDIKVYNNFGQLTGENTNIEESPFLTLEAGSFLPDFKVALYFKDNMIFENAANKQVAIYIWAGVLVIVLILLTGGFAGRTIGRQMKMNRLKNDFIATITHELKTPLASMRVLADTLLERNYSKRGQGGQDPLDTKEYLELICKENKRLTGLIDDFLTFSRMERNKQVFNFEKISPADVAKSSIEAVHTKFSQKNCNFLCNFSDTLPSIYADKDAMVTVLVNLLDNACKYTYDNKQIELKVFREDENVCFSVKDNGIGMTRRQMRKIFDRFYQADSSLSRRAEGTGLGLSIVKFIVDAHKGKIEVQSQREKGSTFTVKMPILKEIL
ncbi:MAG: GHKL domain-containing protein [Sedimentisphaerales bacterium]|nr:GHKL domain-containing protein [Sedimentisphaerales bacterium]